MAPLILQVKDRLSDSNGKAVGFAEAAARHSSIIKEVQQVIKELNEKRKEAINRLTTAISERNDALVEFDPDGKYTQRSFETAIR
jgi:hypothetical protein